MHCSWRINDTVLRKNKNSSKIWPKALIKQSVSQNFLKLYSYLMHLCALLKKRLGGSFTLVYISYHLLVHERAPPKPLTGYPKAFRIWLQILGDIREILIDHPLPFLKGQLSKSRPRK
jgi:hypothetical protein